MATSPPSTPKSTASAGSSGWVLEAQGKDPGSLNLTREISNGVNQGITVRPGTQFRMKPSGKSKVDKNAETAQTAKWGDDLLVTVPGGGQVLLKGFYNKSPNAPPSKMVIEQKNGMLRKVEGRPGAEPSDSPNPSAQDDKDGGNAAGALMGGKGSSSSSSSGGGGGGKDGQPYQEGGFQQTAQKTSKKSKKKSEEEEDEDSGGFFAWFTSGGANSLGALGLLGLSGAKKDSGTTVNVSVSTGTSDTTVPAVSSITISDDTGTSGSDLITKTASQTVSGTLSTSLLSGQTVKVSTDNGSTWTAATATTGSTTFSLSGATLSGSSTLMAKVVNSSLAEGTSLSKAYVLDTTAPTATLTTGTYANTASATVQSSEVGTAYLVNSTISVTTEASITSASGTSWNSVAISLASTNTLLSLSGLVDGSYKLYTVDVAGNVSSVSSNTFTVDATATALSNTITQLLMSSDTGSSPTDRITKTTSQTISGTLSEALGSNETVYLSADGGLNWSSATASVGSTSFSLSGFSLEVGTDNSMMAKVMNTSTLASSAEYSILYTLDTTAPTVVITSSKTAAITGESLTLTFTFSEVPVGFSASDISVTNGTVSGLTVDATDSKVYTASLALSNSVSSGTSVVSVASSNFYDVAGNANSVSSSLSVTIDSVVPTVSSVAITSATGVQSSYLNAGDVVTATATFSEAVTVVTSGGTPYLNLNIGGTTVQAAYASGTGTTALTFTYTVLSGQTDTGGISIAANSLNLNSGTIKDASGNSATITHTAVTDNASYMVDTTAPTATLTTGTYANTASATVQSSETGTAYLVNSTISVTNEADITGASGTYWNLVSISSASTNTSLALTSLVDGTYKLYTVDAAGNLSTVSTNSVTISTTISLGTYGNLIAPVQVEGKWYYHWDRSGDGTSDDEGTLNDGMDWTTHNVLDDIFKYDINGTLNPNAGTDTTETFRYATINGVQVALPTYGAGVDGSGMATPTSVNKEGTAVSDTTTDNPTYNDLLAIWDAHNGAGTSTGSSGVPTGWQAFTYWSATASASGHAYVFLSLGFVYDSSDSAGLYVALQVLPIVIDLNHDGALSYGNVVMDVNGDGQLDATRWAGAQDGVLVWDKYHDGLVHDHSQYAFAQYDTRAAAQGRKATDLSGLAAAFDSNHDGVFDAQDVQFADFNVWQDANQNGVSDAGEVKSLAELGLASFSLSNDGVARNPVDGVHEAGHTTATATDGTQVLVADVGFDFSTLALLDLSADPAANTLTLNLDELLANSKLTLVVKGDVTDSVHLQGQGWVNSDNTIALGEHAYTVWRNGSAQVLIDPDLVNHGRVL